MTKISVNVISLQAALFVLSYVKKKTQCYLGMYLCISKICIMKILILLFNVISSIFFSFYLKLAK